MFFFFFFLKGSVYVKRNDDCTVIWIFADFFWCTTITFPALLNVKLGSKICRLHTFPNVFASGRDDGVFGREKKKKTLTKVLLSYWDENVLHVFFLFLFFFLKVMIQTTAHAQRLYFLHVKHVGSAADLSPATAARKTVSPFDQQTHANYLWDARRDRQLQLCLLIGDAMQHSVTDAASALGIQRQPSESTTYTRNPGPETTVCLFVFCHRQTQYWDTRLFTVYEQRHSLLGCQKKGPKQLDKHSHTPDTHTHTFFMVLYERSFTMHHGAWSWHEPAWRMGPQQDLWLCWRQWHNSNT